MVVLSTENKNGGKRVGREEEEEEKEKDGHKVHLLAIDFWRNGCVVREA